MYVIFNDLELTRNLSTAACARQSRCTSFVKDPNLHVSRYTSTHLLLILFLASFFIFFCFAFVLSFFQIKAQQTHEHSLALSSRLLCRSKCHVTLFVNKVKQEV